MDPLLKNIYDNVLEGQQKPAVSAVEAALNAGLDPATILNEGMIAAMREVGRLFEEGEYYVPEMLIAARAMQSGLVILKPYLAKANVQSAGKVAIGTVKGDLHDIGKNLVTMMLEDVSPEKFVAVVANEGVDILGLSALLTTTMPNMKVTIEALKEAGLRDKVKVMIGGAPVTEAYAKQIGADGYSPDASRAVNLAKSLIGGV